MAKAEPDELDPVLAVFAGGGAEERRLNPSSSSAKLRWVVKA